MNTLDLLMLFVVCRTDVATFARIRCIGKILVARSRPFRNARSRSRASLLIVKRLSTFYSSKTSICRIRRPVHPLLTVLETGPTAPAIGKRIVHALSLHTPPTLFS